MSLLQMVFVVLITGLAIAMKKAIELAVEREYLGWASSLARLCVWFAGRICQSHEVQWGGDLQFIQKEEGRAGLSEAIGCLLAAPRLAVRARLVARKHQ